MIVADQPGTTRDSVDVEWDYAGQRFVLVDTAGIRKRPDTAIEDFAMQRSQTAIERSDVIWLVVNADEIGDHELKLANLAYESGKPVIVVVNKWDLVPDEDLKLTEKELNQKLFHIQYAPRVFTSAVNEYGIHEMLAEAMKLYDKWKARVPTAELNRWLGVWLMKQRVPNFQGRNLRMYFMTQVETAPPTFAIFCNREDYVTRAYEGFLMNRIREDLDLAGIPVKLKWKQKGAFNKKGGDDDDDQADKKKKPTHHREPSKAESVKAAKAAASGEKPERKSRAERRDPAEKKVRPERPRSARSAPTNPDSGPPGTQHNGNAAHRESNTQSRSPARWGFLLSCSGPGICRHTLRGGELPLLFPASMEPDQHRTCRCALRSAELQAFSSTPSYRSPTAHREAETAKAHRG